MADGNTYSFPIPASAALSNANASAHVYDAPAIQAGTVRTIADVTNAARELSSRKRLKANIPPTLTTVTSDEVSQSLVRQTMIVNEYASGAHVGGLHGAPAWVGHLLAHINARFDAIDARFDAIDDRFNAIDGRFNAIDDQFICEKACRSNSKKARTDTLVPLVKVRSGNGENFPTPHTTVVPALPNPPADVGTRYPDFPQSFDDLASMTHSQIAYLAGWANEDFGILAEDSLAMRREKFRQFIAD